MSSMNRRSFVASTAMLALVGTRVAAAQDATPAAGPIIVEGAMGTIELDAAPERVVALEWRLVEDVLALGMQPAGIADIEGYTTWVNVPLELSDDVADVGSRLEPSLESVSALQPDLILAAEGRHEPIYDDLTAIAPTLVIPADIPNDDVTPIDANFANFRLIATALGREEIAETVIAEVEQTLADGAAAIDAAGRAGEPYVVVQAFTSENVPTMRIFSDDSQIGQTLSSLGLDNAWQGTGEAYGFDTITVEALVEVADANFFYVVQDDDNIFEQQLAEDPIWNSLTFVQDGRTYALGGDTWTFGGARSLEVIVEKALTAFLGEDS